jgi:hypothetical protein
MNAPVCRRFYRKCEDFNLCINIGDKGFVLAEHSSERYTIFYYGLYGSGKFGKIFESDFITLDAKDKKLVDVKSYVNSEVIFQSNEDFCIIGFNTLDKSIDWDARLLDEGETTLTENSSSILICLDGSVTVDGVVLNRYNYSKINPSQQYSLQISENTVVALFTKIVTNS